MKMINKLMVVLGLAVTLVGCGDPERLSSGVNWAPEASAYLNDRLEKPKGAQSEWALEVKNESGIRIVRVFVDGKKTASIGCNPSNRVANPLCDVVMNSGVKAIHWDESDGYRVGGADIPPLSGIEYVASGEEAAELLSDLRPLLLRSTGYAL